MNKNDLSIALSRVDERFLTRAEQAPARPRFLLPAAAAVLACVLTAALVTVSLTKKSDPFLLTAYALSEGEAVGSAFRVSENASVDRLPVGEGLQAFVLSYPAGEENAVPLSFTYYGHGLPVEDVPVFTPPVKEKAGQIYLYYVVKEETALPVSFFFIRLGKDESEAFTVLFDRGEDGKITVTVRPRMENSSEGRDAILHFDLPLQEDTEPLWRPYREALARVNEEYGLGLTVPEGKEKQAYNVYVLQRGLSPEAFAEAMKDAAGTE